MQNTVIVMQLFSIEFLVDCMKEIRKFGDELGLNLNLF